MPSTEASTTHPNPLSRAVRAVSSVTLLSRVGGLIRDVLIARLFASSPAIGSAFAAAFQLPNLFRRLFGEGALSAAFIPEYSSHSQREGAGGKADYTTADPSASDRLASLTLTYLGLATSAITIAAELILLVLLLLLPHDPDRALSLRLIMVMLPFMPLICAVAILAGMLQVHDKFAASASGPILLNAFIVAVGAFYLLSGRDAGPGVAYAMGIATVLSGVTQLLWFLHLLRPHVRWTRQFSAARAQAAPMLARFIPVAIGLGTLQLSSLLDTLIAMWPIWVGPTLLGREYPLDKASNLILSVTTRLYQFPLGVFGIAVATAAFPLLARHADEPARFADTLRRGLRLSLFIGLPASLGLILVRHDAVAVMFGYSKRGFTPDDLTRSAAILLGFAPAVWAYSLNQLLTRVFYARKDTTTPMRVALVMVGFNLILNLILIWPLREAGLAWATSICATIQCLILALLVRRSIRAHSSEPILDPPTRFAMLRTIAASLIMAACVWAAIAVIPAPTPATWLSQLLSLSAAVAAGLISFLAAAKLLHLDEVRWLLQGR